MNGIAYVFADRIAQVALSQPTAMVRGLAYVMAHEVGHLLLGVNSHADAGLMRPSWNPRETWLQTFTARQVQIIRQRFTTTSANAQGGQGAALGDLRRPAPINAALDVLKWSPENIPRIEVVDERPPRVSSLAEGWIVYDVDGRPQSTIYIAGWSALYRAVLANRLDAQFDVIRLAGVLAHERAHIEHGPNEEVAYLAQLTTLESLRAHDSDLAAVRRALAAVSSQNRVRPSR